jgi:hypothetical protein
MSLKLRHRDRATKPAAKMARFAGARWQGSSEKEMRERLQRAAVERSGEGGAAGVVDLGVAEAERLELGQHPSRRRRRTCRRRRRHEGGEALVAERVVIEMSTSSAGSRRKAGARVTSPASPMAVPPRPRNLSRGRAPRPRDAASAEAPASPTRACRRDATGSRPAARPRPASPPAAARHRGRLLARQERLERRQHRAHRTRAGCKAAGGGDAAAYKTRLTFRTPSYSLTPKRA